LEWRWEMIKFIWGVVIGILIFFFFLYFGGGKNVKKVGEDLSVTGKKMEAMEEVIRKGKEDIGEGIKKFFKEEKAVPKKGQ
jgi:hypothetical protein